VSIDDLDLSAAGVVPERTDDPAVAFDLVARDGAAILVGCGRSSSDGPDVAHRVFADHTIAVPAAAEVTDKGVRERRPDGLSNSTRSNCHTDGYSYGWQYPDHFLLLCDEPSEHGGESFLVSGDAVLTAIARDPDTAWVAKALQRVAVDQTQEGMRPLIGPLVSTSPTGRRMFVMANAVDQHPASDTGDRRRDEEMIATWRSAVYAATDQIEHFKIDSGEAVIVDNYRLFHGREPYASAQRRMWRVWMWTDTAAFGAPEGVLHSDSREAPLAS
jgi:gamma-butyrobetaine dioxygenase